MLAIAFVGALTLVAVANALWFQVLTLKTTAATGDLRGKWQRVSCVDNEPPNPFPGPGDPFPIQNKDVGHSTRTIGDEVSQIIVTNGYPGYAIDCEVEVRSTGTVPIHVERVLMTIDDPSTPQNPDFAKECLTTDGFCQTMLGGPDLYDLDPLTPPDPVYAEIDGVLLGCQLHTNDRATGSFIFGVRQPAKEKTTYVINLYVQFNQWNESAWTGCNTPKKTPIVPVLPLENGTPYDPALRGLHQQP